MLIQTLRFIVIKNNTHTHAWSHQNQLGTEKREGEQIPEAANEPHLLLGVLSFLLNVAIPA